MGVSTVGLLLYYLRPCHSDSDVAPQVDLLFVMLASFLEHQLECQSTSSDLALCSCDRPGWFWAAGFSQNRPLHLFGE